MQDPSSACASPNSIGLAIYRNNQRFSGSRPRGIENGLTRLTGHLRVDKDGIDLPLVQRAANPARVVDAIDFGHVDQNRPLSGGIP
jgi:hypothetical protein